MENTLDSKKDTFLVFFWRVTATHMTSYFILGILAYFFLDYENFFSGDILKYYMKPTDSRWVAAGPLLQVFRGLIFSAVLWPIREIVIYRKKGWLKLWLLIVGIGIFSTAGPSPGSMEGLIYTKLALKTHILGLPEVLFQTLLFSWWLYQWYRKPTRWKNILFIIAISLIVFFGIAGIFAGGMIDN